MVDDNIFHNPRNLTLKYIKVIQLNTKLKIGVLGRIYLSVRMCHPP
jgi:hypothetical protein